MGSRTSKISCYQGTAFVMEGDGEVKFPVKVRRNGIKFGQALVSVSGGFINVKLLEMDNTRWSWHVSAIKGCKHVKRTLIIETTDRCATETAIISFKSGSASVLYGNIMEAVMIALDEQKVDQQQQVRPKKVLSDQISPTSESSPDDKGKGFSKHHNPHKCGDTLDDAEVTSSHANVAEAEWRPPYHKPGTLHYVTIDSKKTIALADVRKDMVKDGLIKD